MTYTLIALYTFLFAYITWRRFEHGLFLFFLLLPTYLIRFPLFGVPTTLLEVMFWILFGVWALSRITYHISHSEQTKEKLLLRVTRYVKNTYTKQPLLFTSIILFLLGATISIFTSINIRTALGEWKAFYVEPVILFLLLVTTIKDRGQNIEDSETRPHLLYSILYILTPLLLCGLITSLLAIYQHFTGWYVPYAFWENRATYRVTAWYGFPNGVGLFLAPLVPLAIGMIISFIHETKSSIIKRSYNHIIITTISLLYIPCSILAILFAKSTGALIGIAASIGFLLLLYKKTRWLTLAVGIVGIVSLFSVSSLKPIRDEIFFQDRSGQIRLAIYDETIQLLKDRPIFGAGIASYDERIAPYHGRVNGESIEIFHHPHNIFLTMWVNIGLIGLIGFLGIIVWCFKRSYEVMMLRSYEEKTNYQLPITHYLLTPMIVLLTSGLVDSPYIKNDLAFLFWAIISIIYSMSYKKINSSL